MQFRTFKWPETIENIITTAPNDSYPFFAPLLVEAQDDGFDLESHEIKAVALEIVTKNKKKVRVLAIGVRTFLLPNVKTTKPTFAIQYPERPAAIFLLAAWHAILVIHGNPAELHVKWTPTDGERHAFLNVEAIKKVGELNAVSELFKVLKSLKSNAGRPSGTSTYTVVQLKEKVWEVDEMAKRRKITKKKAAGEVFEIVDLDLAYTTYYRAKQAIAGK